ncbi:MAG TPA: hypothetical protein VF147_07600 [Vicinamibacterales bacterium]
MTVWKTWSFGALDAGITSLYGVGGTPPERGIVRWKHRYTTVDYPPVALYELAAAGAVYRALVPDYHDSRWLNAAMKLPGLLAEILLALLVWRVWRQKWSERAATYATLAVWLNPAMILAGPVLGYLDPLMALPAIGAILAAFEGRALLAGALFALACLTKAQAVFIGPVVALATWNASRGGARVARGLCGFGAVTAGAIAPYVAAGAGRNMLQGVGSLLRHDMLSGDAANVWWVVTYVLRAIYAVADLGLWGAWTMQVRILGITQIVKLGYPNPRLLASAAVVAAAAWAVWTVRRDTRASALFACGAFIMHAYFVLGVQVHENHLYLAVPLLALASATRPGLAPVLTAVSGVFALNLFLFFGIGRGFPLPPRNLTVIDTTVLLAIANTGLLVWHARRFRAAVALEEAADETAVHLEGRPSYVR